ncbi:KH domain-containing protein [Nitrosopumilus sp. S6]
MPLHCKKCEERRYPQYSESDKGTLWLCNKCQNYTDAEDVIIREQTQEERDAVKAKAEEFEKTSNFPAEKLSRRKGVN